MKKILPLICPKCNQRTLEQGGHGSANGTYSQDETGYCVVKINVIVRCMEKTCDGFRGYVPFDLILTPDCLVIEEYSMLDKLYNEQLIDMRLF